MNTNEQKKAQHTPGDWTLRKKPSGNWFIYDKEGEIISGVSAVSRCRTMDENTANARLLAAAPELLEVARAAIEWAGKVPAPYREWPFVVQARAAIAKATGEGNK